MVPQVTPEDVCRCQPWLESPAKSRQRRAVSSDFDCSLEPNPVQPLTTNLKNSELCSILKISSAMRQRLNVRVASMQEALFAAGRNKARVV